jgi:metal-responsive CopG/Arc/MetJ family transcriptional regulator
MGRPKTINQKKSISLSINIELDELLDKICEEKNINKSKYIEHLIKNEIDSYDHNSKR